MPKFLIERQMPGAGSLSEEELRAASQKSRDTLAELDAIVHWQQSYVTSDAIYCVWVADSETAVREHARRTGFPVSTVRPIVAVLDPASAE